MGCLCQLTRVLPLSYIFKSPDLANSTLLAVLELFRPFLTEPQFPLCCHQISTSVSSTDLRAATRSSNLCTAKCAGKKQRLPSPMCPPCSGPGKGCCPLPGKGTKACPKQMADVEQELHVETAPTQPQTSPGRGKTVLGCAGHSTESL